MSVHVSRDARLAELLLDGETFPAIATELGVSVRQLRRLRARPRVVQLVSTGQRACLRESRARLSAITSTAIDTIAAVLADVSVAAAVRASTALRALELAHALGAEADFEHRLSDLEAAAAARVT